MTKLFERISDAWGQWFDGLSEREKKLVVILFIVLLCILVLSTVYIATSKVSKKRTSLTKAQDRYEQIRSLEQEFAAAKKRNERALNSIRRNRLSLFTFIQGATSSLGLKVGSLDEQSRPLAKSEIVEVSVRLRLDKLSMDKVTALIEAIETTQAQGKAKITRLKIDKRFDEPDLLDVQMTVSTWKSA